MHAGCYRIKGDVLVRSPISGTLELYVQVRTRASLEERPIDCSTPSPTSGCGGFGSCVYCGDCGTAKSTKKLTQFSIKRDNKELQCERGGSSVDAGVAKNIELSFCMPTKAEFMKAQNLTEKGWQDLQRARGPSDGTQPIFMSLYVFNMKVSTLAKQQQQLLKTKATQRNQKLMEQWR